MADVILDTEDLLVLGGPQEVSVDIDFGPKGDRGSLIFSVAGNPNQVGAQIPVTPLPYDLAINILPSDPRYLTVYQYISQDGVQSWVELAQILPNVGIQKLPLTFTNGLATINIDVSTVTSQAAVLPINFGIVHSIQQLVDNNPIASSFKIADAFVEIDGKDNLAVTFSAAEFNGTSWTPVSGLRAISLFITVV